MIPFAGVIREGDTGTQPVAVKRGLYRAGFRDGWADIDGPQVSAEIFGSLAVANLETFQSYHGLRVDGVYGPKSHAILQGSFDAYAKFLYQPPGVHLPANFVPTHPTDGLPGYPAIDVSGHAGAPVYAPCAAVVSRLSGRNPSQGGRPHGAYGWSIYLDAPHARYFLTHFGTRNVELAQQVTIATVLGTVCDAAVAHMPSSASHIHEGKHEL